MKNLLFNKFFLISFLLLITTLFVIKIFNLVLTIPTILIGIIIILVSKIEKFKINKYLNLLFINSGLFFVLTGIIFSIANIIYFFKNFSEVSYIYKGGYFDSSNYVKSPKEPLGYRYKKNKTYKTSLSFLNKDLSKENIYDVIYTINNSNNRYTPNFEGNIDKNNSVLFLGCSFTFGEGLNDFETLSYYLQESTGMFSINAGLHGYGSHQALHILENDSLFNKKVEGSEVKVVIYRALEDHNLRMKKADAWGPCYKLNDKEELTFRGNLDICDDDENQFSKFLRHSSGIREPFTKYLFRKIFYNTKNYTPENYSKKLKLDFKTFIKSIVRMRDISESRGARFIVLNEDLSYDSLCKKSKRAQAISENLKKNNIEVHNTSEIFKEKDCYSKKLFMSDNHPTAYNNYVISNYLSELIKPVNSQN